MGNGNHLRLAITLAALCLALTLPGAGNARASCVMESAPIRETTTTDIYWDAAGLEGERHGKFVFTFVQAPDALCPESIASARVRGPDGYRFRIRPHRPLTLANLNGYVDDHLTHTLWLMGFDRSGFLPEGEYRLMVRFTNGDVYRAADSLRRNRPLLRAYKRDRDQLSFSPSGETVSALAPPALRWTTLREVGGPSAYYSTRLSEPLDGFVDPHHLRVWDFIFYTSYLHSDSGRDAGTIPVPPGFLEPGRQYVWFTEIVDANRLDRLDLAIFQPAQFFQTQ